MDGTLLTCNASGFFVVEILLRFHDVLYPVGMPRVSGKTSFSGVGIFLFYKKSWITLKFNIMKTQKISRYPYNLKNNWTTVKILKSL